MAPEPERLGSDRVALPRDRDDGWRTEPEVLGREGPGWTPPRWVLAALAVVVLLGGLAWYGDHRLRADEERALAGCRSRLQAASSLSDVRLNSMFDYLRPSLTMVIDPPRQRQLKALMATPARRVLSSVERADRICRSVVVHGWHLTFVAQRRAATAYSAALLTWVHTIAGDGRAYFRSDAALRRLRTAAGLT